MTSEVEHRIAEWETRGNPEMLLDLSMCSLFEVPPLPPNVIDLDIAYNSIREINILPDTLKYLACGSNQIRHISKLPPRLETLNCNWNELVTLPPFPETLHTLFCGYNKLSRLPDDLRNLNELTCTNNKLTQLPYIPEAMEQVYAEFNQINTFPMGGQNLRGLYLSYNFIDQLPCFLPARLNWLIIVKNKISEIRHVTFPQNFMQLMIGSNPIRHLPDNLPDSIEILYCEGMMLRDLPETLPAKLSYINCSDNQISELPECLRKIVVQCDRNRLPVDRDSYTTYTDYIEDLFRKQRYIKKKRSVDRTRQYKEELVQTVWHPERLERIWFSKGLDFEDFVFCDPLIT